MEYDFETEYRKRRAKFNNTNLTKCHTCICVLENPTNIQNIGTIIRNVNFFGIEKVYIIDKYNLFNEQSWRDFRTSSQLMSTSVSAIKWTYVKLFQSTDACFEHLKKNKFTSIITSPHIKGKINIELKDGIFTDKKLAIWFGNETTGISDEAINKSDRCVQINGYGIIESLNLATCTGIVLHEVSNQRRIFTGSLKKDEKIVY